MSYPLVFTRFLKVVLVTATLLRSVGGTAQSVGYEQHHLPGDFNWTFLKSFPEAARLFNAFDYGHAVLSEVLWTQTADGVVARLDREYEFLTQDLLVRPPRYEVAEAAIAPSFMRLAGRAQAMFHWAHLLHRQIYDVYASEKLTDIEKRAKVEEITDYYLTSPLAFSDNPKSMALMDEQYYSQIFRQKYARFNGLIWAYHWLQVGLYEPLIVNTAGTSRKAGVQAAVARFFEMVSGGEEAFPVVMPMTPTVAPEFTARHPRAAMIFDNLHMMHDIISDILASDLVPQNRKGHEIETALREFHDGSRNVMSVEDWRMMGHHMGGVEAMGGDPIRVLRDATSREKKRHGGPHD